MQVDAELGEQLREHGKLREKLVPDDRNGLEPDRLSTRVPLRALPRSREQHEALVGRSNGATADLLRGEALKVGAEALIGVRLEETDQRTGRMAEAIDQVRVEVNDD